MWFKKWQICASAHSRNGFIKRILSACHCAWAVTAVSRFIPAIPASINIWIFMNWLSSHKVRFLINMPVR